MKKSHCIYSRKLISSLTGYLLAINKLLVTEVIIAGNDLLSFDL